MSVRTRLLGQAGAVETITVSPNACQQWAFGPNGTTSITALDWARYYLCEMWEDVKGAGSWVSNELVELWDWLWGGVQSLGREIQKYAGNLPQEISKAAHQLWQGVVQLWNRVQQEWETLTNWTKFLALAFVAGVGAYAAYKLS